MEITPELLQKYVKGTCSKAEAQEVKKWLNHKGGFENLKDDPEAPPYIGETLWNRIKTTKAKTPEIGKSNFHRLNSWGIAASIMVLVGLGTFWLFFNSKTVFETNAGELKTFVLDDGTNVILNVATALEVSKDFGHENRRVTLNGEAYFEVKKDSLLPFIVSTNESVTEVLGTKFNLSAYRGETNILTLDEGRVLLYEKSGLPDSGMLLTPNEQAIFYNGKLSKKIVDPSQHKAWILKKLVFEDQPFASVIRDLERFYGIDIEVKKQGLNNRKYNGTHANAPLESILEDMGFVFKFKYRKEGNKILIF